MFPWIDCPLGKRLHSRPASSPGSSWSQAYSQVQQLGLRSIYNGGQTPQEDARVSLDWLEAFGVGAIAVNGPKSRQLVPFPHPVHRSIVFSPSLWFEGMQSSSPSAPQGPHRWRTSSARLSLVGHAPVIPG